MAEIADLIVEGAICEGCQRDLRGEAPGHPRRCYSCTRALKAEKKQERAERHQQTLAQQQRDKKVPCLTCGRRFRPIGLADHQRDAHGTKPPPPEKP